MSQSELFTNVRTHDGRSYYNTTRLNGDELKKATMEAVTQEDTILQWYTERRRLSLGEVFTMADMVGYDWPITSVRRAITNLTNRGLLVKTDEQVEGLYGRPEYVWCING